MDIQSNEINVNNSDSVVYKILSNCSYLERYLPPDKLQNFRSTENECSFSVAGVGEIELTIVEQTPFSLVEYSLKGAMKMVAKVQFFIRENEPQTCILSANIQADIPFFMATMLKPQLLKVLSTILEVVKQIAENQ
ncbi:MAG: hypothetical protein LBR36_10010 [Bacteroidales bacterium]|jgi:hypothetical protein|nr:hypothetical protein [Bacteroidales bacterium]